MASRTTNVDTDEQDNINARVSPAGQYVYTSPETLLTTRGYGPSSAMNTNLDKLVKIPFQKDDIFVDFKHQFLAVLEGKRLKKFVTNQEYNTALPEDHPERLLQVYVYNSIAACLERGGLFLSLGMLKTAMHLQHGRK